MRKLIFTLLFFCFITPNYCQNEYDSISLSTRGIYNTFYDFMIGSSDEVDNFYVDSALLSNGVWTETYFKTPKYLNTQKRIKGIWGFSDGIKTYININNNFFEIFKDGDQLCFYGFGLLTSDVIYDATIVGGLAGGAIIGYMESENAKTRKNKYFIEKTTANIFESKFFMKRYKPEDHISELIVYRISNGENIDPFMFLIDSVEYKFSPNSYLKLVFPYRWKPVVITYVDINQQKKEFLVHLDKENQVFIRGENKTKKGKIEFIQVEQEFGSFESYKPHKKQKKRDKN